MIPNGGLTGVCFSLNKWLFLAVNQSLLRLFDLHYSFLWIRHSEPAMKVERWMDIKPGNGPGGMSSSVMT